MSYIKNTVKKIICVLAASALCAGIIPAQSFAYDVSSAVLLDVDLSQVEAGSAVPNGVGLNKTASSASKFMVIDVDKEVSAAGKAVEYAATSSNYNSNSEIYFLIDDMVTSEVEEPVDYYIDLKLMHYPVNGSAVESGMTVKLALLNTANTAKRLFFAGMGISGGNVRINAGTYGGYADGYCDINTWYHVIYDVHIAPEPKDCYVALKAYKVGEEEPEDWQTTLSGEYFGENTTFINTANVNMIGIKSYKSLFKFADFSVSAYTEDDINEYNLIRGEISKLSEAINAGTVSFDEAVVMANEVQARTDTLQGGFKLLAKEALNHAAGAIQEANEKVGRITQMLEWLENEELNEDNCYALYTELAAVQQETEAILFAEKAEELKTRAAVQEERIIGYLASCYKSFEEFAYSDGDDLSGSSQDTDNGWQDGWSIASGSPSVKAGALAGGGFSAKRTLARALSSDMTGKSYISWDMTAENGAGINAGSISAGVTEKDGLLYPYINESIGETPLEQGADYRFLIGAEQGEAGMYVYGSELKPQSGYAACDEISEYNINEIELYAADAETKFDNILIQSLPAEYGKKAFDAAFEAYAYPFETDEQLSEKKLLSAKAELLASELADCALKEYLEYVCAETGRMTVETEIENLFAALDKGLSVETASQAQAVIDGISNAALKAEYQQRLDEYKERIDKTAPVIEAVGIKGTVKVGETVTAEIKCTDTIGNAGETLIEWKVNSETVQTGSELTIANSWSGKKLVCTATPKNTAGVAGDAVSSSAYTIAAKTTTGGGGSGGSGSSGGNSGSGIVVTQPVTEAAAVRPEFADINGHWAMESIKRMAERGVVNGVSDTEFEPDRSITRAEFLKLIVTAADIGTAEYNGGFSDVEGTEWFCPYLAAAYNAGIVSGNDGRFLPNDNITREEAVQIIVSVYTRTVKDAARESLDRFEDKELAGAWAVPALETALAEGLVSGISETEFGFGMETTRAQAVVLAERLMDKLNG